MLSRDRRCGEDKLSSAHEALPPAKRPHRQAARENHPWSTGVCVGAPQTGVGDLGQEREPGLGGMELGLGRARARRSLQEDKKSRPVISSFPALQL